jgi:hypothetical protein
VTSSGWTFVLTDALETVLPTRDPRPIRQGRKGSVFLTEPYSVQLAFRPPPEARMRMSDLHVELSGSAAPYASTYVVDLVPAMMPAFPDHDDNYLFDAPGLYPDVLRPVRDGVVEPLVGHWRSVWIDICVPTGRLSGDQDLELVISVSSKTGGDQLFTATVPVTVIDQELPPLDIVNTQWLHADCILDYYGGDAFDENHWQALDAYIGSAARMGITSLLTPIWTPPLDTAIGARRTPVQLVDVTRNGDQYTFGFGKLGRWLGLFAKNGIIGVEVAHLFTQWGAKATPAIDATVDGEFRQIFGWDVPATDPSYRAFLEQFLPELRGYLAEHWDESKIIFHISDEPTVKSLETYRAARDVVADLLDGCRVIDALSDLEFYRTGLVPNPVVATNHAVPFLDAEIENLWFYYCVSQNVDVANRFIAMPPARHRVIGQQLFAIQGAGFLHWGFNFYNRVESRGTIDPYADTCSGGAFPAGDPFIVYPGPDRTVIESTRHRVAAQAMHDHRALQLLRDKIGREETMKIIDPDGSMTFTDYPRDPDHFLDTRDKINSLIRD